MLPEAPPPNDPSAAELVEAFAMHNGLTLDALVTMTIHSLAKQLQTTGSLSLPLQIGHPSPHCQQCPFARIHRTLPDNVRRGPW